MSTRKRKPPEKRRSGNASRLISGSASLIGSAVMRKPAVTGGTVIFAIIFSFVATNALWYQPATHPHPWLDTRDAFRNYASHAMSVAGGPVTTFRVEHNAQQQAAQQRASAPAATPAPATTVAAAIAKSGRDVVVQEPAPEPAQNGAQPAPEKSTLVADIQSNLARRGLYDGAVDGLPGPKTEAAILFYQETRGLPQTGNADVETLELLKRDNAEFNIIPTERPGLDVTGAIAVAPKKAADPVAALISKAPAAKVAIASPRPETRPETRPEPRPIPRADIKAAKVAAPAQPAKPVAVAFKPASGDAASAAMIMQIQKGLANLAYKDVAVDGVMGQQTSEAISHFQKHYRLPVTGQANAAVLDKLKKIGAL